MVNSTREWQWPGHAVVEAPGVVRLQRRDARLGSHAQQLVLDPVLFLALPAAVAYVVATRADYLHALVAAAVARHQVGESGFQERRALAHPSSV